MVATASLASVLPASPTASRFGTLKFQSSGNVTRATFNNPPINLVDAHLISELFDFVSALDPRNRTTPPPKLVIFASANPDFFLDHLDLNLLLEPFTPEKTAAVMQYTAVARLFQSTISTVFIAEINGEAFGAGHEWPLQMDMRFAGPKTRTGSIENALGPTVGDGGQLFLGSLINKGRALEYLLGAKSFDGPTGAALGLYNSYYNTSDSLTAAVNELAARIGQFPREGLNETKYALNEMLNPSREAEDYDANAFMQIDIGAVQQTLLKEAIAASQNQTRTAFELGLPDTLVDLSKH